MTGLGSLVQTIADDPLIYLSMPVTAGLVGWLTKLVAIQMIFKPMEFRGIGPIGWQGMVPRRVAKFASMATDTFLDDLLDPREMLDRVEPARLLAELESPLVDVTDEVAREVAARIHPVLWDGLPGPARSAVLARVRARSPEALRNILAGVRADLDDSFDPRYLTVSNMVRNKHVMNQLITDVATPELRFMVWTGALFGFLIGIVQAVVWGVTQDHLVLPLFGGFVGLFTDYVALQMIFRPHQPRRIGPLRWQGLFFRRREEFTRAYAKAGARDLLSPRVMIEGILEGPLMDRVLAMVDGEIADAIAAEGKRFAPVAHLTIGSKVYDEVRAIAISTARARAGNMIEGLERFAHETFELEETVAERMLKMDDDTYEGLLRPIFKEDEWIVIAVGGALGFLVGELQVMIITHL